MAVPAYPPHPRRGLPRLAAIARSARPAAVLTTAELLASAAPLAVQIPELAVARWLAADDLPGIGPGGPELDPAPETPAFLQYTSGSTASPKGVVVTHGNLLHNEAMIGEAFGQGPDSVVVGWLPLYHDMGLIGNVLQPLYSGGSCVLMSPVAFLQRPRRWLEAIARYRRDHQRRAEFRLRAVRPADPSGRAGGARSLDLAGGVQRRRAGAGRDPGAVHRRLRAVRLSAGGVLSLLRPGRGDAVRLRAAAGRDPRPALLPCRGSGGEPGPGGGGRRAGNAETGRLRRGLARAAARHRRPGVGSRAATGPGGGDLGRRSERGRRLLGAAGEQRRDVRRHARRRGKIPAHGRSGVHRRRRAVRHRPSQGPDHPARAQSLSPGHRADGGTQPPGAPSRLRRELLAGHRRRGAPGRAAGARAPGPGARRRLPRRSGTPWRSSTR